MTYNKVIVRYHKGDVIMSNKSRYEWKTTVVKGNITYKPHEDYLLNSVMKLGEMNFYHDHS